MRLAETLKLNSLQAPGYYALALRAIGQDLAKLLPTDLEVETQADGFSVRGHCPRGRVEGKTSKPAMLALKDMVGTLFRRRAEPARPDPGQEIVEFRRFYSSQDIDRLDQLRARLRGGRTRISDPRTLGESLRTIGRMIDANNCRLTLLKKSTDRLVVEYRDTDDQRQTEEFTNIELYKLQRSYYGNRGTFKAIDMWKGRQS